LTGCPVAATVPGVTVPPVISEYPVGPALAAFGLLLLLFGFPAAVAVAVIRIGLWSRPGDALIGWARLVSIPYLRYFQRMTVEGAHLVPGRIGPHGLIVVSNHCAGLDPVALQSTMHHPIRWMMSAEMMLPSLVWAWRRLRIIPVCFDSRDAGALKTAIAHVSEGGVLGIFPEGGIERPPRQLRPFSGGLRLILSRTKAPVLVAAIDPGDVAETAYGALFKPTRARVRFLALIEPGPEGHGRDGAERVFELLKRETAWPVNDAPAGTVDAALVERNLRAFAGNGGSGSGRP
jgi:1-acyl-sn-glycerol-3-phosphate acyltransferase